MRKLIILVFILISVMSYSQENWQEMMFDKSANFYDIQTDFYKYYKKNITNPKRLPKGKGIKQFKRWEYYWENRVDENGNFPSEGSVLEEITRYRSSQENNVEHRYATGSGTWEIVGPVSLPNNGTTQLNGNGRLNCITFHPTDSNTIFVGAPSGGFWKSTDAGATWTDYLTGLVRLGVSSIVIDPSNTNTIYIATGDRDGGDVPGYGVWRSTDGGLTWAARNTGMGNRTINELIMDPTNSNIMLAANSNGYVYRTSNGGANWTRSAFLGFNPKDIAYHPTNSNIAYTAGDEFHKSTDGGVTWSQITNGVPGSADRIAIAVSPNQPDWVYLLAGGGSGLIGIYRSSNSGTSFSPRTTTPNILGYETDGSGTASQAWYDLVIAADPTDANTIYTGGVNMWKSTNGGSTMACVSYWVGPSGSIDGVHADQHVLEFSPYTNDIYSGNDGGIYSSSNAGVSWNDLSSGLAIAQIYKIGVSQNSDTVINGYQDNGTGISRGTTFTTEIGGDGMECIIDPTDDTYMYGALYYGDIRRSTNGGLNFSQIAAGIPENGAWVVPYKLDPNNANRMFAGYDNIWRNDAVRTGTTWTQISSFGGTSNIRDLAIAPSNSNVMYVSRYDNSFHRSTNAIGGSPTWTNLTANLPVANEPVDIEIDPTDPTHLFIALNNNIYESIDSGGNWTDISGTLPNISLNTIIIDANSPLDAMYVGMDVGVYYKDNNLADWITYSNGLANLEITELEIRHDNTNCQSKLYAATYGQGLWISDLKDPGNTVPATCFEANFTTGCVGNDFTFTDYTDYSPTSWSWTITPATFTYINTTSSTSQNPEVRFTNAGSYTVELTATNSFGSDTNTKVAYITISNGTIASSFNEDFETEALCGTSNNCAATICGLTGFWTNLTNGTDDNIDWRIDQGGTPSSGTGPSVDFNPGTATGNYAYLEASGCYNNTAILESNCIIIDQAYDFIFGYHMYGVDLGSLHVDILDAGLWQLDVVPVISGNIGNTWNDLTVDLSPYVGKTIKIRIRGITGVWWSSDIAIDDIRFIPSGCSTTVWNGSNWSSGTPTLGASVEISGFYDTSIRGSFECCSLLVNPSGELIIEDSDFVVIDDGITNNGIITVKNNGSLIQIDNNGINVGNITYERTANIRKQDYVYWSSPLQGFNVNNISPLTPSGLIYKWDPIFTNSNGGQGYWINASNEIMMPGKGYIVRGPSDFDTTLQDYTATFSNGIPNNGSINNVSISRGSNEGIDYSGTNSVNITRFDDNWNLIGNPYPSAINVLDFLNLNSGLIEGAVRIWTHGTLPSLGGSPFYGDFETNYSASDYITHNGTGTVSGPLGFNGYIAGGQGFLILMNDGPAMSDNVVFDNTLRNKLYVNNQFYRTTSPPTDKSRIWLNLSNEDNLSDRTLIGYLEDATDLKDRLYDAFTSTDLSVHRIYTFIEADKMTIQAFALPFSNDDIIPLGINIPSAGNYSISIHALEGLFSDQQIYVEDLQLNTINNISNAPYTFYSEANVVNDRFNLRFYDAPLSVDDFEVVFNTVIVTGGDHIKIESKKDVIKNIVVFDILGRKLTDAYDINAHQFIINSIVKSNSVLLLKITLSNNTEVYKRIIF